MGRKAVTGRRVVTERRGGLGKEGKTVRGGKRGRKRMRLGESEKREEIGRIYDYKSALSAPAGRRSRLLGFGFYAVFDLT